MKIVRQFKWLVFFFGIYVAPQLIQAEETNLFSGWVILPAETTGNNWGFPKNLQPLWNPPTNLVAEAIKRLPAYLQAAQTNGSTRYTNELPGIQERLSNTGCQFVGITVKKQKGILLNCFPVKDASSNGWKEHFIKIYDGGPEWWSVVFLQNQNKFTRLRVNLGF